MPRCRQDVSVSCRARVCPLVCHLHAMQGVQLPSSDNKVFLIAQNDGNLVLYNQSLVGTYGTTQAAAIWYSGARHHSWHNTPGTLLWHD